MDDGTVKAMAIVLASQRTMKTSTMPPVSYPKPLRVSQVDVLLSYVFY